MNFIIVYGIVFLCLLFIVPRFLYNDCSFKKTNKIKLEDASVAAGLGFFICILWPFVVCAILIVFISSLILDIIMFMFIPEHRPILKNKWNEIIKGNFFGD
ncbi:MAG: hypothetical protein EKK64_00645 [Neisseriaceae bacterium]|nr:MAG: hypothetical protein EKK64_00645 [Neisseriaceae bacterium]